MQKKKIKSRYATVFIAMACVVLAICSIFLFGCSGTSEDPTAKEYEIEYNDDTGTHSLTVTEGMPYSLVVIPAKTGYTFTGLYDAEGTQYVTAGGKSVNVFTSDKNIVLYPQFKANEYSFVLDFQGASASGARQFKAEYGSLLPELPHTVSKENYEFLGWYTESGCRGVKVADGSGLISSSAVVTEKNFNLNSAEGYVILYAGFKEAEYTITFYSQDGSTVLKSAKAKSGTEVSELVNDITTTEGYKVLSWSSEKGGVEFTGKITGDLQLYVNSYAVNLVFNSDGGTEIATQEIKAGTSVILPTPEKQYFKFIGWTVNGVPVERDYTVPNKNTILVAKWERTHYEIKFDTDGGRNLSSLMVKEGEQPIFPNPIKEGFAFIKWTYNGQAVDDNFTMSAKDIVVKAVWQRTHYKVTFNANGGDYINSSGYVLVKMGETCTYLAKTSRTGYDFKGWKDSAGNMYTESITPIDDVVLTADWAGNLNVYGGNGVDGGANENDIDGGIGINAVTVKVVMSGSLIVIGGNGGNGGNGGGGGYVGPVIYTGDTQLGGVGGRGGNGGDAGVGGNAVSSKVAFALWSGKIDLQGGNGGAGGTGGRGGKGGTGGENRWPTCYGGNGATGGDGGNGGNGGAGGEAGEVNGSSGLVDFSATCGIAGNGGDAGIGGLGGNGGAGAVGNGKVGSSGSNGTVGKNG